MHHLRRQIGVRYWKGVSTVTTTRLDRLRAWGFSSWKIMISLGLVGSLAIWLVVPQPHVHLIPSIQETTDATTSVPIHEPTTGPNFLDRSSEANALIQARIDYSARATRSHHSRSDRTSALPSQKVSSGASSVGPGGNVATDAQLNALSRCEDPDQTLWTHGPFRSFFQWLLSTWQKLAPHLGIPASSLPEDSTYEQQREVARLIPISAWGSQFPVCSRNLRRDGIIP